MCPLKGGCGRGKTSCALAGKIPDIANSVIGSVQIGIRRVKVKKFILSSFFLLIGRPERKFKYEKTKELGRSIVSVLQSPQ